MKRTIAAAGLAALGTGVLSTPANADIVLNYSSWLPWSHPVNEAIYIPWMEQIEKASGGKIKFRRLPKPVASPPAHLDAIRTGQADAGMGVHGYSPKRFAPYLFAEQPFIGDRATASSLALWRTHVKYFADKDYYRGVRLIGVNTHGPGVIHHREKLVLKPEDFRGQKIRTGGPIPRAMVEAWGGTSIRQPAPKSYELLSTGVVDGITFPWESLPSFKIIDLVKFSTYMPGGLYSSTHYAMISERKYGSMTAEEKAVIDKYSGEAYARLAGQGWDEINDAGFEAAKKNGNAIQPVSPEMVAAVRKLNVAFEKEYIDSVKPLGLDGREVMDYFHAELKKAEGK
jgi:TRAP-type C4-dicarboxylate transport system substrate-binding protein